MQKSIFLVSRDEKFLVTHMLSLVRAGYRVYRTSTVPDAITMAVGSELVILGHTVTPKEQVAFVDSVHETNASIYVLCLRCELSDPQVLVRACHECFKSQPGGPHVRVLEAPNGPFWARQV